MSSSPNAKSKALNDGSSTDVVHEKGSEDEELDIKSEWDESPVLCIETVKGG
jgi:hypothetical protein